MKNFIITLSLLITSFVSFAQEDMMFIGYDMPENAPANSTRRTSEFHVTCTEQFCEFGYEQYMFYVTNAQLEQFATICKKHSTTKEGEEVKLGSFKSDKIRATSNTWDKSNDQYFDITTFDGSIEVWSNGNSIFILFPSIKNNYTESNAHKIEIPNDSYEYLMLAVTKGW